VSLASGKTSIVKRTIAILMLSAGALLSSGAAAAAQNVEFLLSPSRAGTLSIGAPVDSLLRNAFRTRLVDLSLERHFSPAIEIYLPDGKGSPALVAHISQLPCWDFRVAGITVYDPRFRTAEGLRVGSTIGELRRAYDVRPTTEEGHSVVVPAIRMTFGIAGSSFADSVAITSIWMWSGPEEVKDRCPQIEWPSYSPPSTRDTRPEPGR
jgi:hypothetical protein